MAKTASTYKTRLAASWLAIKEFFEGKEKDSTKILVMKEFFGLIMFAVAIMLALALMSYDSLDNQEGIHDHDLNNWLGPLGARLSYGLIGFLGILSISMPIMALLVASRWFFGNRNLFSIGRFSGISLLVLGLAPLFSQMWPAMGGRLGVSLGAALRAHVSKGGLWVMGLTACASGFLLIINRPYVAASLNHALKFFGQLGQKTRELKKSIPIKEPIVEQKLSVREPLFVNPSQSFVPPPPPPEIPREAEILVREPTYDSGIHIIERDREAELSAIKLAEKDGKKAMWFSTFHR